MAQAVWNPYIGTSVQGRFNGNWSLPPCFSRCRRRLLDADNLLSFSTVQPSVIEFLCDEVTAQPSSLEAADHTVPSRPGGNEQNLFPAIEAPPFFATRSGEAGKERFHSSAYRPYRRRILYELIRRLIFFLDLRKSVVP
jgi:hypothetical protein